MHRFYLEPVCFSGDTVLWDEKESRHICRVLRLKGGDTVAAFDGGGMEYTVRLEEVSPERVCGRILKKQSVDREIPVHLELVQGVAKADKMDWIIQKAVEVGISRIQPIITQYTVVKLEADKQRKKQQRWDSIAREACKQCRRNTVPEVRETTDFSSFLRGLEAERLYILFYEATEGEPTLKECLTAERKRIQEAGASILIGPEGGWSEDEVAKARECGIRIVGLGPRILRTETAGLVGAAAILYEMGAME